jgi:hypothetical protein
MRGWVCRLQLLLVLASAVILRSESRGTHDHNLLPQIQDSPNLEGQVPPYLYPPGAGWPSYTPRHWAPFSSPRRTRRVTVELFDPASARAFAAGLRQRWICTAFALGSVSWLNKHRSGMLASRKRPCGWWKQITKNISTITWLMKWDKNAFWVAVKLPFAFSGPLVYHNIFHYFFH